MPLPKQAIAILEGPSDLPADTAWTTAKARPAPRYAAPAPTMPPASRFEDAVRALRSGEKAVLVLSGRALRAEALALANQIVQRTGAGLLAQYANGRMERGAGRARIDRTPAAVEAGVAAFKDAKHVILIGAKPAPMFGYPGKPDFLAPPEANVMGLAAPTDSLVETLRELAERVGAAGLRPVVDTFEEQPLPAGPLTPEAVLRTVAQLVPDHAIIVDESISAGRMFFLLSTHTRPHDYLQLTGGSIGGGLPMATGAALACPERKVINMEGDGSSMYTFRRSGRKRGNDSTS